MSKLFTSDLSGQEFWLVLDKGYVPLGFVMGNCVYHVRVQNMLQSIAKLGQSYELTQFTEALYQARELAMSRMEAEAERLGADGVVGVRLEISERNWGESIVEFTAVGTAVKRVQAAEPTDREAAKAVAFSAEPDVALERGL